MDEVGYFRFDEINYNTLKAHIVSTVISDRTEVQLFSVEYKINIRVIEEKNRTQFG